MNRPRMISQSLLDEISAQASASPRKRKNFNFHETETDASHRLLNGIEPGSYIPPHRHEDPVKDESIVIVRGRLGAVFFDAEGKITEYGVLQPGGPNVMIEVAHGTFHTVLALEPGTVFFEAKAGPYLPLNATERASWAPQEGDPDAQGYLARLTALFAG